MLEKKSVLDDFRRPVLKVNWKTQRVAQPWHLSPSSARQASHNAEEPATYVDYYKDADHYSRSGLISNKADRLFQVDVRPEDFVVPRANTPGQSSGFGSSLGETPPDRSNTGTPESRTRLAALKQGFLKQKGFAESVGESLPVLGRQLLSGDQLEVVEAVITILQTVQGESSRAAECRGRVGEHPGIVASLIRALKICDNNYKHVIYQTLSQVAFSHGMNALLILREADIFHQVYEAAHTGRQDMELEVARLLNNLAAAGAQASSLIANDARMVDALKRLCQSPNFHVRSRAVGALNVLSRHPGLQAPLFKAGVVNECLAVVSKEGGTKEEYQLFCLTLTCAIGNLMGTIERKSWTADAAVMGTAVHVLHNSLEGKNFAGVHCPLTAVLQSLRSLAVSKNNQIALINYGVINQLVPYLESWIEDADKDLNDQLASLELALSLVTALSSAPGCKLKLRAAGFGPCLFNIRRTKPSQSAVSLARKLIACLHLVEEDDIPGFGPSFSGSDRGHSSSGHRSSLLSLKPRPSPAPLGGRSPSLGAEVYAPRPTSAGWSNRQIEILDDPKRRFGQEEEVSSLKWNLPARRACVRLVRTKVARGWGRMVQALRDEAGSDSEGKVMRGELYQLLAKHRVWLEGEDWEELMAGCEAAGGLVDTAVVARGFEEALWPGSHAKRRKRTPEAEGEGRHSRAASGDGGGATTEAGAEAGTGRLSRELVERVLERQMLADLRSVRGVLSEEDAGDGTVALPTLREVTERIGWGLSQWEWERVRQTLDATGSGRGKIGEYLQIHAEAVDRQVQPLACSAGAMVQSVARTLEEEARSFHKVGATDVENVVGAFHATAGLERVKVRAVRERTSRLEQESRPLSPLGREKNAFLQHKAPAMVVVQGGDARGGAGGSMVAKETVNSFAAVQRRVPRALRHHVTALAPEHEELLDSSRSKAMATTYQHFTSCPSLVPFRAARRPLGHGGEWHGAS